MLVTGECNSKELGSSTVESVHGGAFIRERFSRDGVRENDDTVKSNGTSLLFNPRRNGSGGELTTSGDNERTNVPAEQTAVSASL